MGPIITLNRADGVTPSGGQSGEMVLDVRVGGGRQGRNAVKRVFETDLRKAKVEELMVAQGNISSSHLSAKLKKKVLGDKYSTDAYTAAQSNSIEHTLEKDASRQYLDINFSIGDSVIPPGPGKRGGVYNEGAISMPHRNMSISNMSASEAAAKTDYSDAKKYIRPSSLYSDP